MEVHVNQHSGRRPWQCEVCGLGFKGPSNLKTHMHQHEDGMRYHCDICKRKFRDRGTCQQHVKRHLGEKKHVCEHCGKSFVITSDLKKHIRTHTGEKPFSCKQCNLQFSDGSSFARHEKMHTAKFRYQCTVCSKQYTRRDACTKHIKKTHKDLEHVDILQVSAEECRLDERDFKSNYNVTNPGVVSQHGTKTSLNPSHREQSHDQSLDTVIKISPLKKSWQNFETLTQEASRRFKEQTDMVGVCSGICGSQSTIINSYQGAPLIQTTYGNMSRTLIDNQRLPNIPQYDLQTLGAQVYQTNQLHKQNTGIPKY